MTGAREYAPLFPEGKYGRLYIDSGRHARGYYFHIWVMPEGLNNFERGKCVEVYGIRGGHPGWTEWYGWLHQGKWVQDFEEMVVKRVDEIQEAKKIAEKRIAERAFEENARVKNILDTY